MTGTIPFGMISGLALYGFDQSVNRLDRFLSGYIRKFLAGFVLFFAYLIGYILIFSLVNSYPLEWLIENVSGSKELAEQYGMYSINFIIFFSIISWFDWLLNQIVNQPGK